MSESIESYGYKEPSYITFLVNQVNGLKTPYLRRDWEGLISALKYLIAFMPSKGAGRKKKDDFLQEVAGVEGKVRECRKKAAEEVRKGRADKALARGLFRNCVESSGVPEDLYRVMFDLGKYLEKHLMGYESRSVGWLA